MKDERRFRARFHRFIEGLLPWYDPEVERMHDERTEAIRQKSIAARVSWEEVRDAYAKSGSRQVRR